MKCKIKGFLKNTNEMIPYDTIGIYQPEKKLLSWKEKDSLNTTIIVDFINKQIIRENKELKMILTFHHNQDKILNCKLKTTNSSFKMNINVLIEKEENNHWFLVYETYLNKEINDVFIQDIKLVLEEQEK